MSVEILKKYLLVTKINLKHNFIPHFALACVFLVITPLIFGISNLDKKASIIPLEMFVSLIGIMLLTHVFMPEQNPEIEDVIRTKKTNYIWVCLIRIVYSVIILMILIVFLGNIMNLYNSDVSYKVMLGTFISGFFLGTLGMVTHGITKNIPVSYMIPVTFYGLNFTGGDKLGNFYLFSMTGGSFQEKWWLLGTGVILIIGILSYKKTEHGHKRMM